MPRVRATLVLRASAKINLTLHVGGQRPDGFHEVRTLLQSIALTDRLTMTARRGPFSLFTRAPGVPVDRTNLVSRAADLLWRALGRGGEPSGVHATLEKQIPVAAGLGGGSADAAATLLGLNVLWNARLSRRELARLGADLGSDVPFFLHGGTALGAGRGDELYPVDDIPAFRVIVIKPSFGVSSVDAYRWLDEDRLRAPASMKRGPSNRANELDLGWPAGPVALVNDLQAPVSVRHPAIDEMLDALVGAGASAAAMTGSGSAVFGLFIRPVSKAGLARLARPGWLVISTRISHRREAVRRMGL